MINFHGVISSYHGFSYGDIVDIAVAPSSVSAQLYTLANLTCTVKVQLL